MKKLILLIDDSAIDNFINRTVIKHANYAECIAEFQSATDGVKYLCDKANDPLQIPDMIFLDIKMPLLDGFGFLNEFSKLPDNIRSKVKIIMLSSSINDDDIEKANNNPLVFKFLSKPLTVEKLQAI